MRPFNCTSRSFGIKFSTKDIKIRFRALQVSSLVRALSGFQILHAAPRGFQMLRAACFLSVPCPAAPLCAFNGFQLLRALSRVCPRVVSKSSASSCDFQMLRALTRFPSAPRPHAVSKCSAPLMWFANAPCHSVVSKCSGSPTAIQQPHLEATNVFSILC